jgi:hypothetical protein
MAIVSLLPSYWDNGDALRVKFPGSARTLARGGAYPLTGGGNMLEVYIDLASLPTAASGDEQIVLENCVIPSGAFIEKVEVLVTAEPTTSGSPNLDLGFVKKNTSTGAYEELDYNGLLAAADAFEAGTDIGVLVTLPPRKLVPLWVPRSLRMARCRLRLTPPIGLPVKSVFASSTR